MKQEPSQTGFQGLRVGALESRMAPEMERLISRHGGIPVVAPSMKELPLSEHSQALAFGETLLSDSIDIMIFLTGVGCRTLLDILETRFPREGIKKALENTILVVRGPKPAGVMKSLGLHPHILVPEPNTWRDVLQALDASYPKGLGGKRVAVQEYGVSNPELLESLRQRGAQVTPVPVYRWTLPDDLQPLIQLAEQIVNKEISVLLITNAVQVDHLIQVLGERSMMPRLQPVLAQMMVASIGELASERLRQHGFPVDLEPSHPKMGILVKEASQAVHAILATKNAPPI
ncbi:MAG: uroporphyrinogen-III synthase [Nitrospirota bacterium]|nr:uroporphyrinogen-III synthase [Nitrospirota bacterium]